MFRKTDGNDYEAIINGITFICDEVLDDYEDTARDIADAYKDKLGDIADFMLDDGQIGDFFGEISREKLIRSLGSPMISLDNNTVTYCEHKLDDEHIIEFEFDGILEEFSDLVIDG